MDPQQLMQMIMQLMQQPSGDPAGAVPTSLPASGVPPQIEQDDPMLRLMQQLQSLTAQMGGQQSAVNSQRAMAGQAGGPMGGMGGRPPAGSVSPGAMR